MGTKIEFTKIEHNDDVQEGDIIIIPHERGVKRCVLHLAPKTWAKLGLHVRKNNTETVKAMFSNPEQTVMHVVTEVRRKYCPDAEVFSSVSNRIDTQGSPRRPVRDVAIAPLASTSAAEAYKDELYKAMETGLTYGMLIDSLPEMTNTAGIIPNIPSKSHYNRSYDLNPEDSLRESDISIVFFQTTHDNIGCYVQKGLFADACFLTSLKARGASVVRPANDFTRAFIAKMTIKHKSTKVDNSIVEASSKTLEHISKLRKELAHLRDIRKGWKRFYTLPGPMSEVSKALAKATGIKKEDMI